MGLVSYTTLASPVGPLLLAADQLGLRRVCFENSKRTVPPCHWQRRKPDGLRWRTANQEKTARSRRQADELAIAYCRIPRKVMQRSNETIDEKPEALAPMRTSAVLMP